MSSEVFLKSVSPNSAYRRTLVKIHAPLDLLAPKRLIEDFAWQDDAVETLCRQFSKLVSPTGSGKQVIVSAAAYYHAKVLNQRAIIVVPSHGLARSYLRESIMRKNGELYEIRIQPSLDFRGNRAHDSSTEAFEQFLREPYRGEIAVVTNATLTEVFGKMTEEERCRAFANTWMGFDEAHHISGVLAFDENITEQERHQYEEARTQLGDVAEFICNLDEGTNAGMSVISATPIRNDRFPVFREKARAKMDQNCYTRLFLDHWHWLNFEAFEQRCVGYDDDPVVSLLENLSPKDCSLVYFGNVNAHYRQRNPEFVRDATIRLETTGYRVLDLVTQNTQEENMARLQEDNAAYKAGSSRNYDVILSVNLLREGTDYVPLTHVHDFAPSNLPGRTIQSIGRLTRKDERKNSTIRYTSYFRNLHYHATNEEVRKHVSDRNNIAFAGMMGMLEQFQDASTPKLKLCAKDEEQAARFEEKARDLFFARVADGVPQKQAVEETVLALRKEGWVGRIQEMQEYLAALVGLVTGFVEAAAREHREERPQISPSLLLQPGIRAEEIREAGFDITETVRRMYQAKGDDGNFLKLSAILNRVLHLTNAKDRLAADYRFGKDSSAKAKRAYQSRRALDKKRKSKTAIAPSVGNPGDKGFVQKN